CCSCSPVRWSSWPARRSCPAIRGRPSSGPPSPPSTAGWTPFSADAPSGVHYRSMQPAVIAPKDAVSLTDTLPPRWPGRSVLVDGAVTYVRETPATTGTAEPALYVHGLGGSSANWTDLAGLLAHRLDGQAIDLPGFGRSDPARSYSIPAVADRVIRWIEHSDRGPVHLFGNSLGGAIVVRVAGTRPDLVRTLTLISPAMPFLNPGRSAHGRMIPLLWIPRVDRLAQRRLKSIEPAELAR